MLGAASAHAALTYRETAPAGGLSPAYLARQFLSSLGNLSSYHNGAGGLSYADGHAEIKRWQDPRTTPPIRGDDWTWKIIPSPRNHDIGWLQFRSTRKAQ